MRLGVHFGPVFISSGRRHRRRASRRDRRLAWELTAGFVAIAVVYSHPWFALPVGVLAAMAVTWWWLKRQDTKPPAESAPVAGGGSAGREQQVRHHG